MANDDDINQYLPNAQTMAKVLDADAARERIEKALAKPELVQALAEIDAADKAEAARGPRPADPSERVEYVDSKTIPPNNDKKAPRITQQKIKVSPALLDPRSVVTQPKMAPPTPEQLAEAEAKLEAEQAAALLPDQGTADREPPETRAAPGAWQAGPKPKLMTMKVKTEPAAPPPPPPPDAEPVVAPVEPSSEPPGPWTGGAKAKLLTVKVPTVETPSSALPSASADETVVRQPAGRSPIWVLPAAVIGLLVMAILAWTQLHASGEVPNAASVRPTTSTPTVPTVAPQPSASAAPSPALSVEPTTSALSPIAPPSATTARPASPSIVTPPEVSAHAPKSTTVQPPTPAPAKSTWM